MRFVFIGPGMAHAKADEARVNTSKEIILARRGHNQKRFAPVRVDEIGGSVGMERGGGRGGGGGGGSGKNVPGAGFFFEKSPFSVSPPPVLVLVRAVTAMKRRYA